MLQVPNTDRHYLFHIPSGAGSARPSKILYSRLSYTRISSVRTTQNSVSNKRPVPFVFIIQNTDRVRYIHTQYI